MDADFENLTMVNKEKASEEICPKCHAKYRKGAEECPNCGVIFNKVGSSGSGAQTDSRAAPTPPQPTSHIKKSNPFEQRKKMIGVLVFLCIVGVGFYLFYANYIESRIQAGGFQEQLDEFCNLEISESGLNQQGEGEDPYRTGRVLVVSPRQEVTLMNVATGEAHTMVVEQGIHPVWHRLNRKTRAQDPSEVDTLIRIHKVLGKTGRYGEMKTKVYNTHKIVLDVYDWKNQAFIGTKVFDPGEGSAFMTEEDFEAMAESVSDQTIAEYIQSMDIQNDGT